MVADWLPLLSVIKINSFSTMFVVVVVTFVLGVAGVTCRYTVQPLLFFLYDTTITLQ